MAISKFSVHRSMTTIFIIAILMVIGACILSTFYTRKLINASKWVEHSATVLGESEKALSLLKDIESTSRGYIITDDSDYRRHFPIVNAELDSHLTKLKQLTSDNAGQQRRIDSLKKIITKRIDISATGMALKDEKGLPAAINLATNGQGKLLNAKIVLQVKAIQDAENDLLTIRTQLREETGREFSYAYYSLLASVILLLFVAFFVIKHNLKSRTKAEENLRKSFKEISGYKYALDESSVVAITDQEGIITHANNNFCNISGFSRDELIGKNHQIIKSGFHSKDFICNLWITIANGKIWKGELKNKAKNGSAYWVDTCIVPFLDEDAKPYQYLAISKDISERKQLEEQQALFALIVNSSDDAILSKNLYGQVMSWNRGAEKIFGYTKDEIVGKPISVLVPPHLFNEEIEILNKIRNGESVDHYETQRLRKDGETINVSLSISPIRDSYGNIIGASKISRDITERKRAAETLERSLKEITDYKFALDESSIVAITDQKGIITHVNRNFCAVSKFNREELIGQDHRIINSGYHNTLFIRDVWVTITNGKIWRGEMKNRAKDGTFFWVDTSIVPFINLKGKPYQYVAITADITARKLAEEENAKSEMRFKNTLDKMMEGVEILGFGCEYLYVNGAYEKQVSMKKKELLGYTMMEKFPGIEETKIFATIQRCLQERTSLLLEGEFTLADHSKKWFDMSFQAIPEGIFILSVDITERKNAELELKESEWRYRSLIEQASEAIFILNIFQEFIDINQSGCELLGYTKEEFLRLSLRDVDFEKGTLTLSELKKGDSIRQERIYKRKDGSTVPTETNEKSLEDGRYIIFARDISERKKAEGLLRKSELFNIGILDSLSSHIAVLNDKGVIIAVNESWKRFAGENGGDDLMKNSIGQNYFEVCKRSIKAGDADASYVLQGITNILSGKIPDYYFEYPCNSDTEERWFALRVVKFDCEEPRVILSHQDITKSKIAELEISKLNDEITISEKRFRGLIENSHDIVAVSDAAYNPIYRSPSARKINGWSNGDIDETKVMERIHPDDLENVKSKFQDIINNPGVGFPMTFRTKHKNGQYIYLEGVMTNMLQNEAIKGIVSNFRDITRQKKAELQILDLNHELTLRERKFRGLIENSQDIIGLVNAQHEVIYRSPMHWQVSGWQPEDFEKAFGNKIPFDLMHPDDRDMISKSISKSLSNPGRALPLRYRIKHKNGHYIWLDGNVTNMLHDEAIKAIVTNLRDVTATLKAEEKLRESEKIYRTIASNIPGSLIFLLDCDYRYLLIEGDLAEKLGYTPNQLLGEKAIDALTPQRYEEMLPYFKRVFKGEYFIQNFDRIDYNIITKYVPFKDESNVVYAAMVVIIDVTELKKAELQILELNAGLEQKVIERTEQLEAVNKELEAFSYSVSHDLRAPLRAVNGFAKILEEDYYKLFDKEGHRLLQVIQQNANRMGILIDELLEFSRLGRQEIKKSLINMQELVESLVAEVNNDPLAKAQIKINHLYPVMADYALMNHVLTNLISNAVKYSSKRKIPQIEISTVKTSHEYIFSIKDNGVGFDMKYAHKLFGVFQRLHAADEFAGTGVGLAIVLRVINKHKGKVWAEATLNEGAVFYFSIPFENENTNLQS